MWSSVAAAMRGPSLVVAWYGVECENGMMMPPVDARIDLQVWNQSARPIAVRQIVLKFRKLTLGSLMRNPKYAWEWAMERQKLLRWNGRVVIPPHHQAEFIARAPVLPPFVDGESSLQQLLRELRRMFGPNYLLTEYIEPPRQSGFALHQLRDNVSIIVEYEKPPRTEVKRSRAKLRFSWANGKQDGWGFF